MSADCGTAVCETSSLVSVTAIMDLLVPTYIIAYRAKTIGLYIDYSAIKLIPT